MLRTNRTFKETWSMIKKNRQNKREIPRRGTVTVIGIGRVGLPLALVLADSGCTVFGIGRSQEKIASLCDGRMPFFEQGALELLKKHVSKRFFPTTDYSVIQKCDYIVLTLGTPIDENMNPVYDQINSTIESAKQHFRPGQTLILRSTVSPRTTQYVQSLIEDIDHLRVGKNFFLAFCPERIAEGKSIEEIRSIPQIVGGVDKKSTKKAEEFFRSLKIDTLATDDVSAELAKLFTNMYRYINFAIANEFMVLAQNYYKDIYEIVGLVNYNYKRGGLKIPGLTGGPCLFKDGFFLVSELPFPDLITTAWKINESIPLFLIHAVKERMRLRGKKAVILGLAFKAEIDDTRESLSFKVRKALLRERANVILHDPYIDEYQHQAIEKNVYDAVKDADLLFIATNHKQYKNLDMKKIKSVVKKNCIVCDVWNVWGTGKIVYRLNYLDKEDKSSRNS